jgi:HEAT repeat protein
LQTPGLRAQALGLALMMDVTLRFSDGPTLLAPYVDTVAPFLNRTEEGAKSPAIWILGKSGSPKALAYLADHLNDQNNSSDQALSMSAHLLESRDPVYAQKVLNLVEQRPDLKLKSDVINALGLYGVIIPEALNLIREGLQDSTGETRRVAIDAIGHLPKEVRKGFEPDLLQVMTIPNLDPTIRDRAQQVIIQ